MATCSKEEQGQMRNIKQILKRKSTNNHGAVVVNSATGAETRGEEGGDAGVRCSLGDLSALDRRSRNLANQGKGEKNSSSEELHDNDVVVVVLN
jgi:hypothetical protein